MVANELQGSEVRPQVSTAAELPIPTLTVPAPASEFGRGIWIAVAPGKSHCDPRPKVRRK